ncbi:MAG: type II secretion system GspH family protein [Proteobacteria bacterium]|nr:type II secretion system GspH family protein [Pseudomonadota bacterium]MBU1716271.1 type II secretion system GspH family protein [Pseudomonadota bacterium]
MDMIKKTLRSYRNTIRKKNDALLSSGHGFTLIELIMVIVILGVLSVSIAVNWPTGMDDDAARGELKRALRYAQHKAMTRGYTSAAAAWGFMVAGNQYTVQRQDATDQAETEYISRNLLDDPKISLTGPNIYFNGLGEPIDGSGIPLPVQTYTIRGGITVTVSPQTGYVQ